MDLVTPFLTGDAGKLLNQLCDKGAEWLVELVSSHSPAVQAQAQVNLQSFFYRLAKRIEQLEAELPAPHKKVFGEALNQPNSSLLMQKVMVSAATTENDYKHAIFSELIAQRITAEPDDMVTLLGAASCDVVNAFSSKHIRLLGMIVHLFSIRPLQTPKIKDQESYDKYVISWWEPLGELCKDLEDTNNFDLMHLVGLSCIRIGIGSQDLVNLLTLPVKSEKMMPTMEKFEALPWWPSFCKLWDVGLGNVTPTSIGTLIGTLYHNSYPVRT